MNTQYLVLSFLVFTACHNTKFKTLPSSDSNTAQEAPLGPPAMSVALATPEQCGAGGSVYTFFNDADGNGRQGDSENPIHRQVVCNGNDGANGNNGASGDDGRSMVFQTVPANSSQCTNGGSILLLAIDSDRDGVLTVADQGFQSLAICNGLNGNDGEDGHNATVSAFTPVDVITACGNNSAYKEVLLRLQNGLVLASFSSSTQGEMTRLSFLPDGSFMNTDNSGCVFTLATSPDGSTRSISWDNQVQMQWPIVH